MRILIDINHPAHVHLLRNAYHELKGKGHEIIVTVKDIPSAHALLDSEGIPYINIGRKDDSLAKKGLDQLIYDWRIWKLVRKHKIELGIGSSINIAHVSQLSKMKSIILDDDDDAVEPLFVKYAHPFALAVAYLLSYQSVHYAFLPQKRSLQSGLLARAFFFLLFGSFTYDYCLHKKHASPSPKALRRSTCLPG